MILEKLDILKYCSYGVKILVHLNPLCNGNQPYFPKP